MTLEDIIKRDKSFCHLMSVSLRRCATEMAKYGIRGKEVDKYHLNAIEWYTGHGKRLYQDNIDIENLPESVIRTLSGQYDMREYEIIMETERMGDIK